MNTLILHVATYVHLKNFSTHPLEHLKSSCTGQINSLAFWFSISKLMATWRSRASSNHCKILSSTGYVSFLPWPDLLPYSRKIWRWLKFGSFGGSAVRRFALRPPNYNPSVFPYWLYIRLTIRTRPPNLNPANIFVSAALDQTAKFKDRQYFRLYGIYNNEVMLGGIIYLSAAVSSWYREYSATCPCRVNAAGPCRLLRQAYQLFSW